MRTFFELEAVMRKTWMLSLAMVASLSGAAMAAEETISITTPDKLEWKDYPGLPGVKFVVVDGNPREAGPYTIRAKFAPGTMSRPHWHPETRYVTVLKGTWWAGSGDKLDPETTVPVPTGGFAVHTARQVHYDGAKDEEVIVQISGIGPSGTNVVTPAAQQ
jgi:hypothetical protein